jgi:hypothetical protein
LATPAAIVPTPTATNFTFYALRDLHFLTKKSIEINPHRIKCGCGGEIRPT